MVRSMTSNVSALSGCVANGHQTIHSFPPPPLKFRTAGFPQYGFKPAYAAATFAGDSAPAYRPSLFGISFPAFYSVVGLASKRDPGF